MRFSVTIGLFTMVAIGWTGCASMGPTEAMRAMPTPEVLEYQCEQAIGGPRVEEIVPGIWFAIGYDLANTMLIQTDEGNVVVDVSSSPKRARQVRAALDAVAPGKVRAIIYTHSHIDHINGASVWMEEGTELWTTDALMPHLMKQYGMFRKAETRRGIHQFGGRVPDEAVPCSALGKRVDTEAALTPGIRLPTNTFSNSHEMTIGGVDFVLVEAHGETHDQLFVWLPQSKTLLAGDNFYHAFPNLYTIRGTSPRPIDDWIESLDKMRAYNPEHLLPSHTRAVHGAETIREMLTDYRDAVQWIRDAVVRGANAGMSIDELAATIGLPERLAKKPWLQELYGQVDWSVRAMYTNNLGWFDERLSTLYPLSGAETASREIEAMGGADTVLMLALSAREQGQYRWAMHLMDKLRASKTLGEERLAQLDAEQAKAARALAADIYNTNGRAYLLDMAVELEEGPAETRTPQLDERFVEQLPLDVFFHVMAAKLTPQESMDVHESVVFHFPDVKATYTVTQRYGVAEVVKGDPLPGTPEPIAHVTMESKTWKMMALKMRSPAMAFAAGDIDIDGEWLGFVAFTNRFDQGF